MNKLGLVLAGSDVDGPTERTVYAIRYRLDGRTTVATYDDERKARAVFKRAQTGEYAAELYAVRVSLTPDRIA